MNTHKKFREIREMCNVSQLELAQKSGLSNGMICRYEKGKHDISFGNLEQLMRSLNRPIADLFTEHTIALKVYDQHMIRTLGTIQASVDYVDCYAVFISENEIYPKHSLVIIDPKAMANHGDVVSYIDNQGRIRFEKFIGSKYTGVVVKADWSYKRKAANSPTKELTA